MKSKLLHGPSGGARGRVKDHSVKDIDEVAPHKINDENNGKDL